jgi:hypothetical protein
MVYVHSAGRKSTGLLMMHRVAVLLLITAVLAGCIPYGDSFALYRVWVTNRGSADRLLVLGLNMDGSSTQPALQIPADGVTRASVSVSIGVERDRTAAILVYDEACVLIAKLTVRARDYTVILDDHGATLTEVTSGVLPEAPIASYSSIPCPGAVPWSPAAPS